MEIRQYGKELEEAGNKIMDEIFRRFSLMYEHYIAQDEIEHYFVAYNNEGDMVGFIAIGYCGRTVLIEVAEKEQNKGIARGLVKFVVEQGHTKAWQPRQDGCERFWEKMSDWASQTPECVI